MSPGPELASKIIKRWFHRHRHRHRRPDPPRVVRIVLQVNGETFVDINSKFALAMIDCQYGKPVVMETEAVRVTFSEIEP